MIEAFDKFVEGQSFVVVLLLLWIIYREWKFYAMESYYRDLAFKLQRTLLTLLGVVDADEAFDAPLASPLPSIQFGFTKEDDKKPKQEMGFKKDDKPKTPSLSPAKQ